MTIRFADCLTLFREGEVGQPRRFVVIDDIVGHLLVTEFRDASRWMCSEQGSAIINAESYPIIFKKWQTARFQIRLFVLITFSNLILVVPCRVGLQQQ